jgi:hypothetical protein
MEPGRILADSTIAFLTKVSATASSDAHWDDPLAPWDSKRPIALNGELDNFIALRLSLPTSI